VPERAYERLEVDERRRRLLELGADLFTRHAYDELSMADIARAAGISKALLYHYFPSKPAMFSAMLEQQAAELAARVAPPPQLAPREQLEHGLAGFLEWVDEHATAYRKLLRSAGIPEAGGLIDRVREETAARIAGGLAPGLPAGAAARVRAGVRAWLWMLDGLIVGWLEHGELSRAEVEAAALAALDAVLAT
jgi:AcrR family transcriptional regulator